MLQKGPSGLYRITKLIRCYKAPVFSYLIFIFASFAAELFLGWNISVYLMLLIPALLVRDFGFCRLRASALLKGLALSCVILFFYVLFLFVYSRFTESSLILREIGGAGETGAFLLTQFFLIALPEELFFRGYLQREFGGGYRSVVFVSGLFAAAHLVLVCVAESGGAAAVCINSALTFFPSLVMGYLFMKTSSIWPGVAFHFMANVVYLTLYVN